MPRLETERQMRWLMTLRVVTVSTLLVSAFAIELLLSPAVSLRPLFLLSAAAYGMVLLYAVADRWLAGRRVFIYLQLAGDAVLVTGFVGITGGLESPMSFLYLLPICVAALLLFRGGGLVVAGVCWALYAVLATVGWSWAHIGDLLRAPVDTEPRRVFYYLLVHLVAFVAVALLASYLAERLRAQGHELDERRGAVARLQALNENIIESINSGLVTTDLHGKVHFMNRGGAEITGCSQSDVEGRAIESVFELEEGFLGEIRRQLLAHRRFRFERYFERPDGSTIFLGTAVSNLYDRSGNPLGFIFIFQDLTEIQALELEVRLKERMAALGEMAAGMAHELRNPLASIIGAVQYLKGDLPEGGETLELMDIILRESHRLDLAIKDFLTFARPGTFSPEDSDLVKLLNESIKLLSKSRDFRSDHRIETDFSAPEIRADVDVNRVKQVFWNLATNALKAMPDGGTLRLAARVSDGGERIEISFADEGGGMDERETEKYFQPFHGRFSEGTGLGTAIVYRLVEEHGGRIALDSAPGKGTRVRIVLPRWQPGIPKTEPVPAALDHEPRIVGGARG